VFQKRGCLFDSLRYANEEKFKVFFWRSSKKVDQFSEKKPNMEVTITHKMDLFSRVTTLKILRGLIFANR